MMARVQLLGPPRSWSIFGAHVLGDRLLQERHPFADALHVELDRSLGQ